MARPGGKIDVVCQNPRCCYYRKVAGEDIIKSGKYKSTGHQRYYCKHCKTCFIETKSTPLHRKQLPESEIINICKRLVEKNGMRSIERVTGHHRYTIGNLIEDMAEHVAEMNEYLIKTIGPTPFECDELWSNAQKNIEPDSSTWLEECDAWSYTCIKRNTCFFMAFSVGK